MVIIILLLVVVVVLQKASGEVGGGADSARFTLSFSYYNNTFFQASFFFPGRIVM